MFISRTILFFNNFIKPGLNSELPDAKLKSPLISKVTPLGLVVISTGGSPLVSFISAFISFTISFNDAFTSTNFVAFLSNLPSSSALPSILILLPNDFPAEFAISIIFTGSIVDNAANKTKNAKRSVIISANVPNQPGNPSSTWDIPLLIPALNAFFSPDVFAI